MGIRRYIIALKNVLPEISLKEGEKPVMLNKGEIPQLNFFCKEILNLPEKTPVFFCTTNNIVPPIEFIGGRETRPPGDTCKMFYKIKYEGKTADYLFWDGIVPFGIQQEGEMSFDNTSYGIAYGRVYVSSGLATGRANYRMVLLEKIKKAPRSGEL